MPAPSLVLDFAGTQTLDSRITFSRPDPGAFYGPDGLVRIAPAGSPRFIFNPRTRRSEGILREEQRTNYLTYSNDFAQSVWTKTNCDVFPNVGPQWQVGVGATKIVENTANNVHEISIGISGLADNTVHTLSAYVAPAGRTQVLLAAWRKDGTEAYAVFTLSGDGAVNTAFRTLSTAITRAGSFYRCEITFDSLSGASTPSALIRLMSGGLSSYTGDGSSGIYLAHAQLEAGAEATTPIFTTGATATRSADDIAITGSNFSSWFNPSEGTILVEGRTNRRYANTNTFPRLCSFNGGGTNDDMRLLYRVLSLYTDYDSVVAAGGVTQAQVTTGQNETTTRWVLAYKANDFAFAGRGVLLGTDTSGSVPTVNRLDIGDMYGGGAALNGPIARLIYWPVRIANSYLPQLTVMH
jgi:hypothetical protein